MSHVNTIGPYINANYGQQTVIREQMNTLSSLYFQLFDMQGFQQYNIAVFTWILPPDLDTNCNQFKFWRLLHITHTTAERVNLGSSNTDFWK